MDWFIIPGDGGRYYNKTNRLGILTCKRNDVPGVDTLLKNEFWASKAELCEALRNGDVNPHLAEAMAAILVM